MDWNGIWQGAWPGQWEGQGEPGGGPVYADTGGSAAGVGSAGASIRAVARAGGFAAGSATVVVNNAPAPPVQQPGGGVIREAYRPKRRPRVPVYADAAGVARGAAFAFAGVRGDVRAGAIAGAGATSGAGVELGRAVLAGCDSRGQGAASCEAIADNSKLLRRRRDEEWLLLLAA